MNDEEKRLWKSMLDKSRPPSDWWQRDDEPIIERDQGDRDPGEQVSGIESGDKGVQLPRMRLPATVTIARQLA